jgi:hypothetical protein
MPRSNRVLTGVAFIAVIAGLGVALASCGEGAAPSVGGTASGPTPTPLPTRTPLSAPVVAGALLSPAGSIYFGAYVNTSGLVNGSTIADTAALEASLGRTLALHMHYQGFLSNFGDRNDQDDFDNGRVPIESWNCGASDAQIAAGAEDSEIALKAAAIKAFAWPVFVRFFWDPNLSDANLGRTDCYDPNTDLPSGVFSPAEYVAAWDHIRAIFQAEGVTNAVWVWSVNAAGSNPLAYYPGNSEVDWVGMDAYDTGNTSFASTLAPLYAELTPLQKPIMISETGAAGPVQSAFFTGAAATLQTQFPLVSAFVYYDAIYYSAPGSPLNQDWRVTSGALPAFSAFANSTYMDGSYDL